jgi:hypothetical protein
MKHLHILVLVLCVSDITLGQQLQPNEAAAIEAAWASGQRLTNVPVSVIHGFDTKAPIQSILTDATGIARTSTKFWERIEVHLPRSGAGGHIACLMVNSKCAALPVGASLDKTNGVLYWHVPNAYKGDFDLVFVQPGSRPGVVRVTTGTGSK